MTNENPASTVRVRRLTVSPSLLETSASHFQQKIKPELEHEYRLMKARLYHLNNVAAPLRSIIQQNPVAAASLAELQMSTKEEQRLAVLRKGVGVQPATTFSFTANPGFQIIAPPYDLDWCNRGNSSVWWGHKDTGSIKAYAADGVLSAAVGVFLSATARSLVRVAPFAPFSYMWSGFDYNVPAWVRGSVGVVVYVNDDPQPAHDYRAELWNAHFDFAGYRAKGSGSSTVSAEIGRDVLISMEPDNSYLVWVWCAVVAHTQATVDDTASGGTAGFGTGLIDCEMPFMVIDAGPANYVR